MDPTRDRCSLSFEKIVKALSLIAIGIAIYAIAKTTRTKPPECYNTTTWDEDGNPIETIDCYGENQ